MEDCPCQTDYNHFDLEKGRQVQVLTAVLGCFRHIPVDQREEAGVKSRNREALKIFWDECDEEDCRTNGRLCLIEEAKEAGLSIGTCEI